MFILRRLVRFALDQVKGFIATNSGWRFDDLKEHVDLKVAEVFSELDSLSVSETVPSNVDSQAFWVAPFPPTETGIANFTHSHLSRWRQPLDLYSPLVGSVSERYLRANWATTNNKVSLCSLGRLPTNLSERSYLSGIIVLGNSNHMVPMAKHGLAIAELKLVPRLLFYLHDICLHNVLLRATGMDVAAYHDYLRCLYADIWSNAITERQLDWRLTDQLVSNGIFGCRVLQKFGATEFVVNSVYARQLLEADLQHHSGNITTHLAFHPVFDPLPTSILPGDQSPSDQFLIGTFGVPGRDKHTDEVVLAVKQLRKKHKTLRLLISGYQADRYLASSPYREFDWIDVSSPATQAGFERDLAKANIAIQLRRRSLGESSGVVPSLIARGIPTLVSALGSFIEYGPACQTLGSNRGSVVRNIAEWIESWMQASSDKADPAEFVQVRQHMKEYAQQHSTERFNKRLQLILANDQLNEV